MVKKEETAMFPKCSNCGAPCTFYYWSGFEALSFCENCSYVKSFRKNDNDKVKKTSQVKKERVKGKRGCGKMGEKR